MNFPIDCVLLFYEYRKMETEIVFFPAHLAALSYGTNAAEPVAIEDDTLQALRQGAEPGCDLCSLDELFGEDWD